MRHSNFIAIALAVWCASVPAFADPRQAQPASERSRPYEIGYSSPQTALDALKSKPGTKIREENDWIVIQDPEDSAIWSITAPAHPAHPTAVKRAPFEKDGAIYIGMDVKCGADRSTCDRVVEQFREMNARLQSAMQAPAKDAQTPARP